MHISIIPGKNKPDEVRAGNLSSFWQLVPYFESHRVYPYRGDDGKTPGEHPLFSPAQFSGEYVKNKHGVMVPGTRDEHVTHVHFGVLDFDQIDPLVLKEQLDKFKPISTIGYTTFSHGKDVENPLDPSAFPRRWSFRLLFPFNRPVPRDEWDDVWHGLSKLVDQTNDQKCSDPRRFYWLPCAFAPYERYKVTLVSQGTGTGEIDVNAVRDIGSHIVRKRVKGVTTGQAVETRAMTVENLMDLASELRRNKTAEKKKLGHILTKVIEGKIYADKQSRDSTLWSLVNEIAYRYPNAEPESVAKLFDASLGATCQAYRDGDPVLDHYKIVEKFQRASREQQDVLSERVEEKRLATAHHIREAFAGVGIDRDTPYTEDELLRFAETAGLSLKEWKHRWIITHGKACYLYVNGRYMQPLSKEELPFAAKRDLAPAITGGVDLGEEAAGLREPRQLISAYGTVARRALIDFTAQESRYDSATQTIVEASAPLRKLSAEYNAFIDYWLRFLGGRKAELLLDWISVVTRLDSACTILYLDGPRGIGKSTLGNGLSRLWTRAGATDLASAFGNWNDPIARCPLLFADEHMPKELAKAPSTFLREFQQSMHRKLRRRFLPEADTFGAVRVILAANNSDMLHTEENLTRNDIGALAQRILYIAPDPRTADFLTLMRKNGLDLKHIALEQDGLAKHALWLRENRDQSHLTGRFLVEDSDESELVGSMLSGSGLRAQVIHWLIDYLRAPSQLPEQERRNIIVANGSLYVTPQVLHAAWHIFLKPGAAQARTPVPTRFAQALEAISDGESRSLPFKDGNSAQYYLVNRDRLLEWVKRTSYSSEAEVNRALMRDTVVKDLDTAALKMYNRREQAGHVVSLDGTQFGLGRHAIG